MSAKATPPHPNNHTTVDEVIIRRIVASVTSLPEDEIKPDQNLVDDLGVDSITMFDLRQEIENHFRVLVPDREVSKLATVSSILQYLNSRRQL